MVESPGEAFRDGANRRPSLQPEER
jgi:hypothetical protein